ncbi:MULTISPECIES: hypothetical protein [Rhodanobacter]|uniref:hypothetical protein n=1 Tax=Rhodanobacter TaxID=75309 RepID=UPI00041BA060
MEDCSKLRNTPDTQRRGQRVAGIYRRSVMLASGRYALLDDGMDSAQCRGGR